jgi:hypothetical protein
MGGAPRLDEFGLTEQIVEEVRTRDQRQLELFLRITGGGATAVWVILTLLVYLHSSRQHPLLGLVAAPLLGLVGAVIATLPLAILCGLGVLLLYPRHRYAGAVEEYQESLAHVRPCDVCILARGDHEPREDVFYCSRCNAWLCPECRKRYDLRAIAALRARVQSAR